MAVIHEHKTEKFLQNSIDWSLRPMIKLMKFLGGIDLHFSRASKFDNNVTKTVLLTSWAAFVIVSNLAINGSFIKIFYFVKRMDEEDESDSPWANFFWNPQILLEFTRFYSALAFFCYVPVIHFLFFVTVLLSPRWKNLLDTFQNIHNSMKLTELFYRKCRRLCSFSLLLLVLDFSAFVHEYGIISSEYHGRKTYDLYWPSHFYYNRIHNDEAARTNYFITTCGFYLALWARLIEAGVRATFSTFLLFCIRVCEELVEHMDEVIKKEELMTTNRECILHEVLGDQREEIYENDMLMTNREDLEKWKENCVNIFRLIENVTSSYGLIILLFICHDLATSIYKFDKILNSHNKVESVCAFAHQFFRILAFLFAASQVQKEASDLGTGFVNFSNASSREGFTSHQRNTILLQVSEIRAPTITGLDIFELNLKIIFTWIDTAIQYGIVLSTAYYANEIVRTTHENINFVYPCISEEFGTLIECRNISLREVRTAFHSVKQGYFAPWVVTLSPLADEEKDPMINIPEDLLGTHLVAVKVEMDCSSYRLLVHQDAFRLSGRITQWISIENCDLISTNFGFLTGFKKLDQLEIKNCDHVDLALWNSSAPLLTNLSQISITESNDLNNWINFPYFRNGLQSVTLSGNCISDQAIDRILRWIFKFSADSLEDLDISYNDLTRIPQLLTSFTMLNVLNIKSQTAPGLGSLPAGALRLSSPYVKMLNLEDCGITNIQPGAIQGFCVGYFQLSRNDIRRLEKTTFLPILNATARCKNLGSTVFSINNIDCSNDPCHLAWLIRDNKDLMGHLGGGQCDNGTKFRDLDPMGLNHCLPTSASRT